MRCQIKKKMRLMKIFLRGVFLLVNIVFGENELVVKQYPRAS